MGPARLLLWSVATLFSGVAAAQPPRQIDNIWDWRAHQPNPATVDWRERADGLLPPGAARLDDHQEDSLARHLLREERRRADKPAE